MPKISNGSRELGIRSRSFIFQYFKRVQDSNLQCQSGRDPSSGFHDIQEKLPHRLALKIHVFFDMTLTFDPIDKKILQASAPTLYATFILDNLNDFRATIIGVIQGRKHFPPILPSANPY